MNRPRIIVADDDPRFLQKLVSLLPAEFDVVATAADGQRALDLIYRFEPDLVLLDIGMPKLSGIQVAERLAKCALRPRVVICSMGTDPEVVRAARKAGAIAYIFKGQIESDLIFGLKLALQGKQFVSERR